MNDIPKIDMLKALGLKRDGKLKDAMARLRAASSTPAAALHLPAMHLPEMPAGLKNLAQRLGDFTGAVADLELPAGTRPATQAGGLGNGQFLDRAYAGAEGELRYKLYIPSSVPGTPMPLLVMLHGCTQSPDDFALGTGMNRLADERSFLVAYPAQARGANITKCWNWFNTANQQRGGGEAALIAGVTRQVMDECAVRPGRVYVAGLSAGGAMAAILGATYPDLFAAVGVHSGLARGAAHDMPSAFAAMKQGSAEAAPSGGQPVPTIVFHGDRDRTVNPANAARVLAQARAGAALRATVTEGATPDGVTYTRTVETNAAGRPLLEYWAVHGAGHAWAGGNQAGTYTDPTGPDASREMLRFFLEQPEAR